MSDSDVQNLGLPVLGYKATQSNPNIAQVNRFKLLEEYFLREMEGIDPDMAADYRWLNIARTHIQIATMAASRAVFQPNRLDGELPPFEPRL